ncbi:MAG: hypothetical protein KBC41_04180 [Candidatus Pacebacteria bacterium]|nr:hypothetical protein [Candidatus Paceibacterota bacterium]MBP9867241.1 hypothetical protein [Candidatus Paceibacterota bacterium]
MKIVLPFQWPVVTPYTVPIYLGGPVEGGGDWQNSFLTHFIFSSVHSWSDSFRKRILPHIIFYVPCEWDHNHDLVEYFTEKYEIVKDVFSHELEKSFTNWSLSNCGLSASGGLVLYGMFPESKEYPRKDGVPYAHVTMFELGYSLSHIKTLSREMALFVGVHEDFPDGNLMYDSFQTIIQDDVWCEENTREVNSPEVFADWISGCIESSFL